MFIYPITVFMLLVTLFTPIHLVSNSKFDLIWIKSTTKSNLLWWSHQKMKSASISLEALTKVTFVRAHERGLHYQLGYNSLGHKISVNDLKKISGATISSNILHYNWLGPLTLDVLHHKPFKLWLACPRWNAFDKGIR